MLKKYICILLTLSMALSFAACGGAPSGSETAQAPVQSDPAAVETVTEPEAAEPAEQVWLPYDDAGNVILTDRDADGSAGAVSSTSWYASKAGLDVLQAGGNAVDAAYAVAYTLGVVEPYTSGIGGGGFMTVYDAASSKVSMIDFREAAPAAASPDMWELGEDGKAVFFTKADGTVFNGSYSRTNSLGGLSVAVPGEVAGLEYALEAFGSGSFTRRELMDSAINYARNGYLVTKTMQDSTNDEYPEVSGMDELAAYYLDDIGLPIQYNTTITNNDLADTLELIAEGGADAFYTGPVAEAIAAAAAKYNGILTVEDLAAYEIQVREPLVSTYRDYTIYALPPSSSGGTHLLEILNILENYDMASMEINSSEYIHAFTEAIKLAFADREEYMADTAFAEVPLDTLVSKEYAELRYGEIADGCGDYAAGDAYAEHGSTTSFSVVDKDGNMVACTVTIGNFYGSKVAVEGYGFILNDEMYDFDTDPESINCADGGKRPLSSMAPSVVLYPDGTPFMTIGTPGGTRIFAVVAQVIQRMIDYGMDIQDAIDTVRVFSTSGSTLYYEEDGFNPISAEALTELEAMGYELSVKNAWDLWFGGVQGIAFMKDGSIRAGADPRRSGKALAY